MFIYVLSGFMVASYGTHWIMIVPLIDGGRNNKYNEKCIKLKGNGNQRQHGWPNAVKKPIIFRLPMAQSPILLNFRNALHAKMDCENHGNLSKGKWKGIRKFAVISILDGVLHAQLKNWINYFDGHWMKKRALVKLKILENWKLKTAINNCFCHTECVITNDFAFFAKCWLLFRLSDE